MQHFIAISFNHLSDEITICLLNDDWVKDVRHSINVNVLLLIKRGDGNIISNIGKEEGPFL
jgi:hypothetical protein